ncbi:citramalate synthase [Tautonia plasticadhaerens]|uniref:Citramalate synthase n=1 Tax=Tautonia plasticadhaerens TaxID=2527974 RepID=A0A518GXQ3_9BACT|nr:citramalate synthase [Tautonia plasticadhaerens]QDV33332.1 2-isopropylmalate synthase [Tautonia plasticadhaerens]
MTRIRIYDTTLRDGSQGEGVNFSLQDKLLITARLDELGIDTIEGGYPLSNPKDEAYFREVRDLDLSHARVAAFGMTRRRDVAAEDDPGMNALAGARSPVITVVGKSWDLHAREILGVSLEENLRMIADSVAFLAAAPHGPEVVYDAEHFFDGYKRNPEYALKTIQAAASSGASWIVLCDTNGGTLPEQIAEAVDAARAAVSVPLGIHPHNDGELAVANTLAAVRRGATQVQGTINGIGERCGNVDLCSVIANLALKYEGYDLLRDGSLVHLTEVSRYVYELANLNFRNGQPFVGPSAFAHKGGMHVHGIRKVASSYEHIDPGLVGNERRVLVSELSGRSNIAEKLAEHGLEHDSALMSRVLSRVQDLENEGYQFEAAEASFVLLVEKEANRYRNWFERLHYHVSVEARDGGPPITEATVKLRIGEAVEHTVSEGDGPVNALDGALRKALDPHFPRLREMNLVDYKVRVINARAGTAARVRVVIESRDRDSVWGTVGVSENVIEASWLALVDAFDHKLSKDARTEGYSAAKVVASATSSS